jgi:hypothetical protein
VPAAVCAIIGLEALATPLRHARLALAGGVAIFLVLAGSSFQLLDDALTNGPRWYQDYTLYGQQWGAVQVFRAAREALDSNANTQVLVSSTWANGTDLLLQFFFPPSSASASRVAIGHVDTFMGARQPLSPDILFVMTPDEYQRATTSGKFSTVQVERVINYPNGRPGFYFARLAYAPDLDAKIAAEKEARRALVDDQVAIDGEMVSVRHTRIDVGGLRELFDGETQTLGRFNGGNPAVLEFRFPRPRTTRGVRIVLSAGNWEVTAQLTAASDQGPAVYTQTINSPGRDPDFELALSRDGSDVSDARLEIRQIGAEDTAIIHVRELQFK